MRASRPDSEVKGLWFVVARRYLLQSYGPEKLAECVAHLGEPYGTVLSDPLPSAWYPEEALQATLRTLDEVVVHGNPAELVSALEQCSLLAVHTFFRALLRLVPAPTMLRKVPTMWNLIRRGVGKVTVTADDRAATVQYAQFPYFDDERYRLLTLAAIQSLMVLCGRRDAEVTLGAHTRDSLTVHVAYAGP